MFTRADERVCGSRSVSVSAREPARDDLYGVEVEMSVQLSQARPAGAFHAALVRHERRWFDDDPTPEDTEQAVCQRDLALDLPAVFAAVDQWLFGEHKLRVLPHSWVPCEAGTDTGVALLLEGRAIPAHPISGPLGCWG